ncbi:MAG: putative ATPase [Flavobacteriales bacterium]|jgi:putative ATPase
MSQAPLAERMRPSNLEHYFGQKHIVGEGTALRNSIEQGTLPSLIFWGPPGVGKTTLGQIISEQLDRPFYALSAINSGVKDIREVIEKSEKQGLFGVKNPILFIDEIHRFSKSQQDSLLNAVERGIVTLVGATTENPSFEVISALLSRCQVYILEQLGRVDLENMLHHALKHDVFLKSKNVDLKETEALLKISGGDGRKLLNSLELVVNAQGKQDVIEITNDLVQQHVTRNLVQYDKTGEQHYDITSAFIKSIRGSDPNAALYYLAVMLEGGEDLKFIARRLIILASEDIGNANPTALILANNCFQAVSTIGFPESRIILSQCVTYLAASSKSNASYMAINKAQQLVKQNGVLPVPLALRNAPTKLMKELDYGKNYQYSHDGTHNFVAQEFLPDAIKGTKFFEPGNNERENALRKYLKHCWGDKYGY